MVTKKRKNSDIEIFSAKIIQKVLNRMESYSFNNLHVIKIVSLKPWNMKKFTFLKPSAEIFFITRNCLGEVQSPMHTNH